MLDWAEQDFRERLVMDDYEQRAKAFLHWLEQRILQREYIHARMENGRNKELMKAELVEAKQIRARFAALMNARTGTAPRTDIPMRNASVSHPAEVTVAVEEAAELPPLTPKGRTIH